MSLPSCCIVYISGHCFCKIKHLFALGIYLFVVLKYLFYFYFGLFYDIECLVVTSRRRYFFYFSEILKIIHWIELVIIVIQSQACVLWWLQVKSNDVFMLWQNLFWVAFSSTIFWILAESSRANFWLILIILLKNVTRIWFQREIR